MDTAQASMHSLASDEACMDTGEKADGARAKKHGLVHQAVTDGGLGGMRELRI